MSLENIEAGPGPGEGARGDVGKGEEGEGEGVMSSSCAYGTYIWNAGQERRHKGKGKQGRRTAHSSSYNLDSASTSMLSCGITTSRFLLFANGCVYRGLELVGWGGGGMIKIAIEGRGG